MIGQFLTAKAIEYRHLALNQCGSTNAECINAAGEGDPGKLWITAKSQTGGKGSRGRSWVSEPGNLYASLLLVDACPRRHLAELTFVAAIAVRDALKLIARLSSLEISLKWPNDVLLDGKKVSGILLESSTIGDTAITAIGIGINCKHHPAETNYPATDLAEAGYEIEPDELLNILSQCMADAINVWNKGINFEAVRHNWLSDAHRLGETISINLPGRETISGKFQTIDDQGLLLLEQASGELMRISVGDVFFTQSESQEQ